jgi:hypothetical protein
MNISDINHCLLLTRPVAAVCSTISKHLLLRLLLLKWDCTASTFLEPSPAPNP